VATTGESTPPRTPITTHLATIRLIEDLIMTVPTLCPKPCVKAEVSGLSGLAVITRTGDFGGMILADPKTKAKRARGPRHGRLSTSSGIVVGDTTRQASVIWTMVMCW